VFVTSPLWRRLAAEFLGTALLVTAVVGSGIMASRLSPTDVGLQLLENSTATVFALTILILVFGPISGAHFNPVVSAADWWLGRHGTDGLSAADMGTYTIAQIGGAIAGALLADAMFAVPLAMSTKHRSSPHLWLGETVATAGLLLLIFALVRTGRAAIAAPAVGAYIGAAYWFTSSTSFANPAVTVGRAFTDTFAGIAPVSAPGFIGAQIVGLLVGIGLIVVLYPAKRRRGDAVVLADVDAERAGTSVPGETASAASTH
jgi:glycerol uptake facilitator-like aquaporin